MAVLFLMVCIMACVIMCVMAFLTAHVIVCVMLLLMVCVMVCVMLCCTDNVTFVNEKINIFADYVSKKTKVLVLKLYSTVA